MSSVSNNKKITAVVKLQILGTKATPAPPVGSALGPRGVNLMKFCQEFNNITKGKESKLLKVDVIVYQDKSFKIEEKGESSSTVLKKKCNLTSCSKTPGLNSVASINTSEILELVKEQISQMNTISESKALNMLKGSARSMGITVV